MCINWHLQQTIQSCNYKYAIYEQIKMNARRAILASMSAPTTRARSAAPVALAISSSVMAKDVKVYNLNIAWVKHRLHGCQPCNQMF